VGSWDHTLRGGIEEEGRKKKKKSCSEAPLNNGNKECRSALGKNPIPTGEEGKGDYGEDQKNERAMVRAGDRNHGKVASPVSNVLGSMGRGRDFFSSSSNT